MTAIDQDALPLRDGNQDESDLSVPETGTPDLLSELDGGA